MDRSLTVAPAFRLATQRWGAVAAAGLALLAHTLLAAPLPVAWRGAAALLLLGLPGALLALALFEDERDRLAQIFLGLCGGIGLAAVLLLGLQALPGLLPRWLVLGVFAALSALLGLWLLGRPARERAAPASRLYRYLPLLLIVLLGAGLRLP